MTDCLLILSGGMDSGVALAELSAYRGRIHTLSFRYPSKHNERELHYADLLARAYRSHHEMMDLSEIFKQFRSSLLMGGGAIPKTDSIDESHKSTVIPFRNGIFLSIAAGYAASKKIEKIVIANHYSAVSHYPDTRRSFILQMTGAIRAGTDPSIEILSPYCNVDKKEIVRIGKGLEFEFALTYSCYEGDVKHCGLCSACRKRKWALEGFDPTDYKA